MQLTAVMCSLKKTTFPQYSQSEAVLSFFEASHMDLMIGNNLDPTQLLLYSPVTVSGSM